MGCNSCTVKKRTGQSDAEAKTSAVYDAYVRCASALQRFVGRITKNSPDAEDIAQEAFLRAYALELHRPIGQPQAYLFRIAKHEALQRLTRKGRKITESIEDFDDSRIIESEPSAEDEVSAREVLLLHCEAVAELSPQCREVYLLRKVHGLSHQEIATQLGIAVSTVEKHMIKAMQQCTRYVRLRTRPRLGRATFAVAKGRARRES